MSRKKEFLHRAIALGLPLVQVNRPEEHDVVYAFFHGWEQYQRYQCLIGPHQPLGYAAGQFGHVYGLCEDENGGIKRIDPENIRFIRYYGEEAGEDGT